jgi:hypothetical protein
MIVPPAITQANDELPSLIIHLSVTNLGGQAAILTDLVVRGLSKGREVPIVLHAQKLLDNRAKLSTLPLNEDRSYSVFLPVLIKHDESVALDVYCAPFQSALPLSEAAVLSIDALRLDVWVNGLEKKAAFNLSYPDYRDKFKGNATLHIPKEGFAPRWYRDAKPTEIRASLFY